MQRIGTNRTSVIFKLYQDANEIVGHSTLASKNLVATIPSFRVIQTGIIKDIPQEFSDNELLANLELPIKILFRFHALIEK